ncbi:SDR family oxidoreductase [Nocardiopsis sp. HNM0947]|uniref:SDR family oxidoreductase n=1 Tax=Nocardiopsis coralli TaxID=2772213 RepID=A0ABR9PB52_9ACTN|nr:SDR family oxidoreductase [Nocardiopsis coralli]MBE3001068.1 SDR family oxidoreductase [Nocardiopsis coralli]
MDLGLSGAKVLVTGASRGIGRAIARLYAQEGADVALCARGERALEAEAEQITEEFGARVFTRALDVTEHDALPTFVEDAARALGGLDVFVSNVSGGSAPTPDQWQRGFDADLMPFVRLTEAAEPHLKASARGAVVLISTTSALHATRPAGPRSYGAVKAALNHHAASLARTWAPDGVRVNTVSPGPIEFPGGGWDRRKESDPDFYETIRGRIPYGRLGRPEEVARAAAFLGSPAAEYITGQNLTVDGAFLDRIA